MAVQHSPTDRSRAGTHGYHGIPHHCIRRARPLPPRCTIVTDAECRKPSTSSTAPLIRNEAPRVDRRADRQELDDARASTQLRLCSLRHRDPHRTDLLGSPDTAEPRSPRLAHQKRIRPILDDGATVMNHIFSHVRPHHAFKQSPHIRTTNDSVENFRKEYPDRPVVVSDAEIKTVTSFVSRAIPRCVGCFMVPSHTTRPAASWRGRISGSQPLRDCPLRIRCVCQDRHVLTTAITTTPTAGSARRHGAQARTRSRTAPERPLRLRLAARHSTGAPTIGRVTTRQILTSMSRFRRAMDEHLGAGQSTTR